MWKTKPLIFQGFLLFSTKVLKLREEGLNYTSLSPILLMSSVFQIKPSKERTMARKSKKIEVNSEVRDAAVLQVAKLILDMDTLVTRNSDGLDFKEHSVWAIRNALNLAFEAGFQAAQK